VSVLWFPCQVSADLPSRRAWGPPSGFSCWECVGGTRPPLPQTDTVLSRAFLASSSAGFCLVPGISYPAQCPAD